MGCACYGKQLFFWLLLSYFAKNNSLVIVRNRVLAQSFIDVCIYHTNQIGAFIKNQ